MAGANQRVAHRARAWANRPKAGSALHGIAQKAAENVRERGGGHGVSGDPAKASLRSRLDARLARTEEIVESQSDEIDAMQEQIESLDVKVRALEAEPRPAGAGKARRKKRPAARSGAKNGDDAQG